LDLDFFRPSEFGRDFFTLPDFDLDFFALPDFDLDFFGLPDFDLDFDFDTDAFGATSFASASFSSIIMLVLLEYSPNLQNKSF